MVIFRGEHTEGVSQTSLRFIRRGTVKAHSSPTDFASDGVSCARKDELEQLSGINEAAVIKADSDDVVNQLRNLFNVEI